MWATDPDVLKHYAKHYKTGAAMPRALLDKVMAAQKYGQGFATTESPAAAILDQSWYQLSAADAPVEEVEVLQPKARQQARIAKPQPPPPHHKHPAQPPRREHAVQP